MFYITFSNLVRQQDYVALENNVYGVYHALGLISLDMAERGYLMP
jgi:hypothetical protein